jgi:hypothetical protein
LAIPICLVPNTRSFCITNFLSFFLPPIFMYVSAFPILSKGWEPFSSSFVICK